jgi:hypothetical protein
MFFVIGEYPYTEVIEMLNEALKRELRKKIANHKYERSETGLFIPGANLLLGGVFGHRVRHDGKWSGWEFAPNIVVDQGLDHILDVAFSAATQLTTWYIAPFEGNYTPLSTDTSADIASNATESTAYSEANRVTWVEAGVSSQSITNSASPADFSINATKTMYGAFLISNNTKSGTTGTLAAASRFAASRSVVNLDTLSITYTLTAADA